MSARNAPVALEIVLSRRGIRHALGVCRGLAHLLQIPGKAPVDTRNFNQQQIAQFDLGGEHGRRCLHAGETVKLTVRVPYRAE